MGSGVRRRTFAALILAAALTRQVAAQAPAPSMSALDSLLDTRVSTAAKYSQRVTEVAGSVTIVTSDDIDRYGYRTLDEVLATVPGFYVSNDRNYTYIGTRGFSRPTDYNNRILLLVDGNQANEGVFGAATMGSDLAIPLESLERIEIIRGPGSALYGTGAMFGVINLITRSPASIDGGKVSVEAGSYGMRGIRGVAGQRFPNGLGVAVSGLLERSDGQDLFYPEFDSPATGNGVAHDLDWERRSAVLASLSYGAFRLHGRHGARRKAIPTASYSMAFNARGAETWDSYSFLELDFDHQLSARTWLTSRAYYNRFEYTGDYPGVDSSGPYIYRDGSSNNVVGGEVALRVDLASANRLTVGSEIKKNLDARYYSPPGTRADLDLNAPTRVLSVYLQDEHDFSHYLSLVGGVRYDASSESENTLTPRAGLLLRPAAGTTVKLLYGEAFRAPGVYESSESDGVIPNPDLEPERSRTLEAVWQQRLGKGLILSSSLFHYRMRDLIDQQLDTATGLRQYRNVASARATGVETGLDARFGALSAFASYSYQHTVDRRDHHLTNSPSHLLKGGIGGNLASWLRAGLVGRYESSRITVQGTSTDPFAVVDVNLGLVHSLSHSGSLEARLRVNNLFGAGYATPGGLEHVQPAIRQDGRNFRVELGYGF